MLFRTFLRQSAIWGTVLTLTLAVTGCRKHKPTSETRRPNLNSKSKPLPPDEQIAGMDKLLENFTGAHTRLVWAELQEAGKADTFAYGKSLMLKGLDSRDGKAERAILPKQGNYSRPLLSTDGTVILFTDKNLSRKKVVKHYDPMIYRTDWQGTEPVNLADGYAVDCWKDPATGVEWVYAVTHFKPSKALALEGGRLVRFRLDDPSIEETVYDDGPVSPDNVQLSRDGSQASGLFPWPDCGVFDLQKDGSARPRKLLTGCWPSLAPDNSGIAWVFDGTHRSATFFAQDGREPWTVGFNTALECKGREMYHPRWTNHPRYLVLTGPYVPVKGATGNMISKGGATADFYLGRFSPGLDKVEEWLQVTRDHLNESYPDAWIEGGSGAELGIPRGNGKAAQTAAPGGEWPMIRNGLLYVWSDRNSTNEAAQNDGKMHRMPAARSRDAARYGRLAEMQVGGGSFEVESESVAGVIQNLQTVPHATVEMVLLPGRQGGGGAVVGIFSGPNLTIGAGAGGVLMVAQKGAGAKTGAAMPQVLFHLAVVRKEGGFEVFINGEPSALIPHEPPAVPAPDRVLFGGGWDGGILDVGIFGRALTAQEIKEQATAAVAGIAKKPPAPPRAKVSARLVEASAMPSAEGIAPYTGSLVAYVYEIEKVISGELAAKKIIVKHWAMLDQKPLCCFPRTLGGTYELELEPEAGHDHLKGERVMDDTTAFDLETWFDISPPKVR